LRSEGNKINQFYEVRLSPHTGQEAHQAGAYLRFCGVERLGVFLLSLDGMLVHRRVAPSIILACIHLYTWARERHCLAQEHNTMSPARARTRTARSGDEHANHEVSTPPTFHEVQAGYFVIF